MIRRIVIATTTCVVLGGCTGDVPENAVTDAIAAAATATNLDSGGGDCQLDDLLGRAFLFGDDATVYAAGYSQERFCQLRTGMTRLEVTQLLGEPLAQIWEYYGSSSQTGRWLRIELGKVSYVSDDSFDVYIGMTPTEVVERIRAPGGVTLLYTKRSSDTHYRERYVEVVDGRVAKITAGVYVD